MFCKTIISCLLFINAFGQKLKSDNKNKFQISVTKYKKEVLSTKNALFTVTLKNISTNVISISKDLEITPDISPQSEIVYELYHCDIKDSSNALGKIVYSHHDKDYLYNEEKNLNPNEILNLEAEIPGYFIEKAGHYKIKFRVNHKFFEGILESDISTKWIFFNVL